MGSVTPYEPNGSGDPRTIVDRASTSDSLPRFLLHLPMLGKIFKNIYDKITHSYISLHRICAFLKPV